MTLTLLLAGAVLVVLLVLFFCYYTKRARRRRLQRQQIADTLGVTNGTLRYVTSDLSADLQRCHGNGSIVVGTDYSELVDM